jgi:hypothetical protein
VRKPQVIPDEDHEVICERVAAVDVAKASGVVCLRTPDPARPGRFVNRIWDNVPATRARIAELGGELLRHQVQMVTLESTSDYWRVWYYVLESIGLAVQLVSASQAKNLKGAAEDRQAGCDVAGPADPARAAAAKLRAAGRDPAGAGLHPGPDRPGAGADPLPAAAGEAARRRHDQDHLGGHRRAEGQVVGGDGGRADRRGTRPAHARRPGQGGRCGPGRTPSPRRWTACSTPITA